MSGQECDSPFILDPPQRSTHTAERLKKATFRHGPPVPDRSLFSTQKQSTYMQVPKCLDEALLLAKLDLEGVDDHLHLALFHTSHQSSTYITVCGDAFSNMKLENTCISSIPLSKMPWHSNHVEEGPGKKDVGRSHRTSPITWST